MMLEHMSKEDIACVREFMASGNGLAMFEYADENVSAFASADEYVAHMKQAADAGCHLASEALAYFTRMAGCLVPTGADSELRRMKNHRLSIVKWRKL